MTPEQLASEWLETDGLGGFASGTAAGWRTRRYHGLFIPAVTPPSGRAVMLAGVEVRLMTDAGEVALSSQRYAPDVTHPDGVTRLTGFGIDPWPTWTWSLGGGRTITQELFLPRDRSMACLRWRLKGGEGRLLVRPLLAGRDSHSMHHENPDFRMSSEVSGEWQRWHPYGSLPALHSLSNGTFRPDPSWYRNFLLEEERARGFDHTEDLASPGELSWAVGETDAVWLVTVDGPRGVESVGRGRALATVNRLAQAEQKRRAAFAGALERAADQYLVRRGEGRTVIAGYPWFTDWGRDTFIALRGLCLAGGRWDDARAILVEWAGAVSEGQLPNRFVEAGDAPEFNAVDAALWYVIAVHECLEQGRQTGRRLPAPERDRLLRAVDAIVEGYAAGTRYHIGVDSDGLLRAGVPGVQLTWMDAKVGDWVVTPRIGKPVEIQALWINALRIAAARNDRWARLHGRAIASFRSRFVRPDGNGLYDVVDVNHEPGTVDASCRPNQLFAVGGLPYPVLEGEIAERIVTTVEQQLWTPLGPRSLAPGEPGYNAVYAGGPVERDGAYHQGTVWPWLAGPFVEAWLRVRGTSPGTIREARQRFLAPLLAHLDNAGLGHVSEIADATAPHTPRGCPFQAWSVGEVLRLERVVLAPPAGRPPRRALQAQGA
jgi:predicted glycogen debranching enzyme